MRTRALAAGLAVLAMLAPWHAPRAADAAVTFGQATVADPATRDRVYSALGIDRIAADYIILIDVSSSMRSEGRYDGVKGSLRSFFAALAPEDQVTLVPFATEAVPAWQGPAGRSPDALIDRLPATADGANTDIGRALEKAIDLLSRSGAPSTANVVLLSDGAHDPARGSQYPFDAGFAWNELKARAAKLAQTSISATAVPLAGATGATLLRQVFPKTEVVNPAAIGELTAALDKAKEAAKAAKARLVLDEDLTRSVTAHWSAGDSAGSLRLELRSPMRHIPLQLSQITVGTTTAGVRMTVRPSSITLAPGETRALEVTADWNSGGRSAWPFKTESLRVPVKATAEVSSPWDQVLRDDLRLTWSAGLAENGHEATLSVQRGSWAWWLAAIAALLTLGLAMRTLGARRMRPALHGVLSASLGGAVATSMPLSGRGGTLTVATIGLPGLGEVHLARVSLLSPVVNLVIRYSRDGSPGGFQTAECAPGGKADVHGVTFGWDPR